jgi:transcriptional regulator with XRE-family HTH domain
MTASLSDNIKAIREAQNTKSVDLATYIGVDKSAYSKIEKGTRALTAEELIKAAQFFNMTIDDIVHYNGTMPKDVKMDDQTTSAQAKLIQQLDDEDRNIIFKLVEKMLSNKKFKEFFNKNISTL